MAVPKKILRFGKIKYFNSHIFFISFLVLTDLLDRLLTCTIPLSRKLKWPIYDCCKKKVDRKLSNETQICKLYERNFIFIPFSSIFIPPFPINNVGHSCLIDVKLWFWSAWTNSTYLVWISTASVYCCCYRPVHRRKFLHLHL